MKFIFIGKKRFYKLLFLARELLHKSLWINLKDTCEGNCFWIFKRVLGRHR